jgi:predicted N-acetyltransferase YhbS
MGEDLAAVLSLVQGTPAEWADVIPERETWWLHNLATAQNFRGRRLGEVAVKLACERLVMAGVNVIYLDCVAVAGFLPAFYERLGFAKIAERTIAYPSGNSFPVVLMKKIKPCLTKALPRTTAALLQSGRVRS